VSCAARQAAEQNRTALKSVMSRAGKDKRRATSQSVELQPAYPPEHVRPMLTRSAEPNSFVPSSKAIQALAWRRRLRLWTLLAFHLDAIHPPLTAPTIIPCPEPRNKARDGPSARSGPIDAATPAGAGQRQGCLWGRQTRTGTMDNRASLGGIVV
jgi:hypothetical protein